MALKVMGVLLIFFVLVFSISFVFENIPKSGVDLELNYLNEPTENGAAAIKIDHGDVPIFAENLRFNHNLISYSINEGCGGTRRGEMISAFNIFSSKVGVISFYENVSDADIKVGCSNEFIDLGGNMFAAGEGGPSRIINTSGFRVIEEGKIRLYNGNSCRYPIVALHELCHVFGFDHSSDPENIMYNTSSCDQRMSNDMIELMKKLYSFDALADIRIEEVNAVISGAYLNFNISVLNEGLLAIDDINLTILADGVVVDVVNLGGVDMGYGRTLRVENMRIGRGVESVKFVVDAENAVRELDEGNNAIEMGV
jgi:hypothetical protein